MKSVLAFGIVLVATMCLTSKYSFGSESQLDGALRGARSVTVKYAFGDELGCRINQEPLQTSIERELQSYASLRVVTAVELEVPDVIMIISVNAMPIPPGSLPVDGCMYLISLRTYHPMHGQYAYRTEPHFMWSLTFERSAYSVIFPEKISDAVRIQGVRLLKLFFSAHGG
jgi:hypothetical protein